MLCETVSIGINNEAKYGADAEQQVFDYSGEEVVAASVDLEEVGDHCLDDIKEDEEDWSDDGLVDEQGDEDGIGE